MGTGEHGYVGDGGPAISAKLGGPGRLDGPKGLAYSTEALYIADTENHRIVRYVPKEGTLVPVAGTGKKGRAGVGGDPLQAEFNQPHGVIVHPKTGDIYISDASNGRVLKIVRD